MPAAKRLLDVALAGSGLVVSAPVALILAALIKLGDRGPIFFSQERVGRRGRHFAALKFRSMVPDAEASPGEIEVNGDGRVERLEDVPGFEGRCAVLPGLTGVAQIYAPRDVTRRHKFRYDKLYIRNQSFWLDIRLILLSFWITFRGTWETRARKF